MEPLAVVEPAKLASARQEGLAAAMAEDKTDRADRVAPAARMVRSTQPQSTLPLAALAALPLVESPRVGSRRGVQPPAVQPLAAHRLAALPRVAH
jgi:hypothetical protein